MRERAVRTRRKPGGNSSKRARRSRAGRESGLPRRFTTMALRFFTNHGLFSRASITRHETKQGLSLAVRRFFWSEPGSRPGFSRITKHESRLLGFHETRNTGHETWSLWCTVGTEALQSCFFRPGLLGNSTGRRSPCGSRIRASQAFTSRNPLILRSFTKHETRDTSHGLYVLCESRVTKHDSRLCVFHELRVTKHGLYGARWY